MGSCTGALTQWWMHRKLFNFSLVCWKLYSKVMELWIYWRHLEDPRDSSQHFQRNGSHLCNSTSPPLGNNLNNQKCKMPQEQFWFNFLCARIVKCQISQQKCQQYKVSIKYCKMLKLGEGTNHLEDTDLHSGSLWLEQLLPVGLK